jgi:hypothetical protein
MGTARQSGQYHRSIHPLLAARNATSPVTEPEVARASVLAALDGLVEDCLASWHTQGLDRLEIRGGGGEAWRLDNSGVTRLR